MIYTANDLNLGSTEWTITTTSVGASERVEQKETSMRRLYRVYVVDLLSDTVSEYLCVAMSERTTEFKAVKALGVDIEDIENYQLIVEEIEDVDDKVEANNG